MRAPHASSLPSNPDKPLFVSHHRICIYSIGDTISDLLVKLTDGRVNESVRGGALHLQGKADARTTGGATTTSATTTGRVTLAPACWGKWPSEALSTSSQADGFGSHAASATRESPGSPINSEPLVMKRTHGNKKRAPKATASLSIFGLLSVSLLHLLFC
jgi:hypothetical protein